MSRSKSGQQLYGFKLILACLLACLMWTGSLYAQSAPANAIIAQEALSKRGLTQAEAVSGLKEKGYDVEGMSPEALVADKDAIEAILDDLAAKKANKAAAPAAVDAGSEKAEQMRETNTKEVNEAVQNDAQNAAPAAPAIYGHSIFDGNMFGIISTTDGSKAPETYVLGTGDRLRVTIFGASQADILLEINEGGYVQPTGLPQVYLKGVRLSDARNLLKQRFSMAYRFQADQFAVTLQSARTVTVSVFGESKQQGNFSISALNTVLHAITLAGGPTALGSVREIEIFRGGKSKKLDVYDFMYNPKVQFDFDLQQNDIIYIPIARKLVNIEGGVARPMIYELKESEGLLELIKLAGNVLPTTYTENAQIERYVADSLALFEFGLTEVLSGKRKISLNSGDIVRIRSANKKLEGFVEVDGAVFYGGRYQYEERFTLGELLEKAKPQPEALVDFYFVQRPRRDNTTEVIRVEAGQASTFELQGRDKIQVFNKATYTNNAKLSLNGAVRSGALELQLAFGDKLPLSQLLELAGGLTASAHPNAYLLRRDLMNPDLVKYQKVDVFKEQNLLLQAGDELTIYDRTFFNLTSGVSLFGAVKNPVNRTFDPSLSFEDLMRMSGGFTAKSALNRVDVYRLKYDNIKGTGYQRIILEVDSNLKLINPSGAFVLAPFDIIIVRDLPLYDLERVVVLNGALNYPGQYPLQPERMYLSDIISQAGGLNVLADARHAVLIREYNNKGKVGINLQRAMRRPQSNKHDPILMPGDLIFIPQFENTIGIRVKSTRQADQLNAGLLLGQVSQNEILDFVYQGPKTARWYIREFAGGFSKNADKNSVTVTYPDGKVKGTRRYLGIRDYPQVQPGAVITVIEKAPKEKKERKGVDIDGIYTKTVSAVTTVLTILILSRAL